MNTIAPASAERSFRVAWTGPIGEQGGPWFSTTLLRLLAERGAEIEFFGYGTHSPLPLLLGPTLGMNVQFHGVPLEFEWGRWYSKTHARTFISNSLVRLRGYFQLQQAILRRHEENPFDLVFQMSQPETFATRARLARLPPLVVHPCTHAAGELRWVLKERRLALDHDRLSNLALATSYLAARRVVQGPELRKADLVICPSERFARYLHDDYRVARTSTAVLRHPVDLQRFAPGSPMPKDGPIRLVYVSRMSVRKGLELIVHLSHRLDDLADECRIDLIGGATLWSDYTKLTDHLNPRVGRFLGGMNSEKLVAHYRKCDVLLLPSRYEPGALVVGEALAMGLPVIVSDEVGPGEVIDERVCRVHRAGDLDDLERQVRRMVAELQVDRARFRDEATNEAKRLFAPDVIGDRFASLLRSVAFPSANSSPAGTTQ